MLRTGSKRHYPIFSESPELILTFTPSRTDLLRDSQIHGHSLLYSVYMLNSFLRLPFTASVVLILVIYGISGTIPLRLDWSAAVIIVSVVPAFTHASTIIWHCWSWAVGSITPCPCVYRFPSFILVWYSSDKPSTLGYIVHLWPFDK